MKKLSLALLFASATFCCFAQQTEKQANIRKFLELTGTQKMAEMMTNNMLNSIKASTKGVDSTFFAEFQKEVKFDGLLDQLIPIYDKYYSDTEIKELLQFYQSPVGQKVIATLPAITQEAMVIGQGWGKELSEKIIRRMQEKGLLDSKR